MLENARRQDIRRVACFCELIKILVCLSIASRLSHGENTQVGNALEIFSVSVVELEIEEEFVAQV